MSRSAVLTSTDATPIHADAAGDPAHPSIVFVHGFTLSSVVFDGLFANTALLDKYYLVRYDMRGHGRSGMPETPEAYASQLYADDFMAVVREFGLVKPVYVGWSLGAAVITDICAHISPLPIAGAVALCGPPSLGPLVHKTAHPALIESLTSVCTASPENAPAVRTAFVNDCFADPAAVPEALRSAWLAVAMTQPALVSGLVLSRDQDTTKLFEIGKTGELKLLVLHGTKDRWVDGQAVAREMRLDFGDLEEVGLASSHAMFIDDQEDLVDKLSAFVDKVTNL